jgi:hypothetical protein
MNIVNKILGYAIAWAGVEKLGRRQTMVFSLMTAGVSLLAKSVVDFNGKSDQTFFYWFNMVILYIFLSKKSAETFERVILIISNLHNCRF